MAHTYTLNLVHLVFSTKNRVPMIHDLAGLVKNLRGIARNKNLELLAAVEHRTMFTCSCGYHRRGL